MISTSVLLEALPLAVYTTDADGRVTFFNEAAAALWGQRPQLGSTRWCGSLRLYWPDGRPLPHDECPMAIALREGRPIRGVEAVIERPDGTRVPFFPCPTPLKDEAGRVVGAINVLLDATESKHAETYAAQLAAIVESSDDAIISKTLSGQITSWNGGATRIFGYQPSEMIGRPIMTIIPPELHGEEERVLAKLKRGERIDHYETVRVAKDGRRVDVSLTVSPVRDRSGRVIGASKVGRDISDRKQAEVLQHLLIEELNHRVKNTLATVQALVSQSLRLAKSPADFATSFTGRLQALARAHALLTQTGMQGAELTDLVREQVLLGDANDARISCAGPWSVLDAQSAVHLAMVLHELATNARKYGALSTSEGHLSVHWEFRTNGGRTLLLVWKESGGPQVVAPSTRGFGTTLIEQTLQAHGGTASLCYAADGVSCEIKLPLPHEDRPTIGTYSPSGNAGAPLAAAPRSRGPVRNRVLVVEDEPLVAMDLEEGLTTAGYRVVGLAGNIEGAKRLIVDAGFDVALLDVNLAGHPVDDLAATLTQMNIPFAFVTGYGREGLPRGFRDASVLGKPFGRDQLLDVIDALLHPPDRASDVVPLRPKRSDKGRDERA
jgi:PAS domain S-box-containing protein